jgi:zinc/manganese transport system substrate-binding protein
MIVVLATLFGLAKSARAELKVVTTTPDLAAVAQVIGGGYAKVTALALHTQDPHWVDARPNLALELAKADLLLLVGLDLEIGWLPTLQTASRNAGIQRGGKGYLEVSGLVPLLDVSVGKVDRAQGDIHPGGNPHFMYDPRRAAKVARGIAKRMSELDPAHGDNYAQNAKDFLGKLAKWQKHWEEQLKQLKGKKVVAYHKSLSYLADWLGFDVIIHVEPKPGIPPNPGHVTHVIDVAKQSHVSLLIQESYFPTKTSELVAQKLGAKLAVIPGGTNFQGGESYLGFLNTCVTRLSAAAKP